MAKSPHLVVKRGDFTRFSGRSNYPQRRGTRPGSKSQQRWLWHAIDHHTGQVLAYVFGTREDHIFLELQALLKPFGIMRFYTDGWGAYRRHLDPDKHTVGKQHTQKIERKHTTLRARIKRLVRKTICFSKSIQMHDLVIGLFINRFAYGRAV